MHLNHTAVKPLCAGRLVGPNLYRTPVQSALANGVAEAVLPDFGADSANSENRSRRGTRGTKRLMRVKRSSRAKRQRRAKGGRGKTQPERIAIAARCTWRGPVPLRKSSRNEWS